MCLVCVKEQLSRFSGETSLFARNYLEYGGCIKDKFIYGLKVVEKSTQKSMFLMVVDNDGSFGIYSNTPEDVQRAVRETAAA